MPSAAEPSPVVAEWVELDPLAAHCLPSAAHLTDTERARAACFRHDRDRTRFIARRCWLRDRLATQLSRPAAEIGIIEDDAGKPRLACGSLAFSLAHSRGVALLVYGSIPTVGCDLEYCDPGLDVLRVGRLFGPDEKRALARLPRGERQSAFYRAWTLKEAFAKASGQDLDTVMKSFDASAAIQSDGWQRVAFAPKPGYQAAIVAPGAWHLVTPHARPN